MLVIVWNVVVCSVLCSLYDETHRPHARFSFLRSASQIGGPGCPFLLITMNVLRKFLHIYIYCANPPTASGSNTDHEQTQQYGMSESATELKAFRQVVPKPDGMCGGMAWTMEEETSLEMMPEQEQSDHRHAQLVTVATSTRMGSKHTIISMTAGHAPEPLEDAFQAGCLR